MDRFLYDLLCGTMRDVRCGGAKDPFGGGVDGNDRGRLSESVERAGGAVPHGLGTFAAAGSGVLDAWADHGRKGRIRRRMDASYDRPVYRPAEVFFDPADRIIGRVVCRFGAVGVSQDIKRPKDPFCAVFVIGSGGCGMYVKKKAEGYMTVEAAFIVTWTLFLFVFLIYLSFYSYDKCVLFQDAYAVCFRGSIQKEEDQIVPYISAHMKEQFGKKYFAASMVQGSVDRQGNVTDVIGECKVQVPIRSVFTLYGREGWHIRTRARAQIINPTHIIRKSRRLENVIRSGE